MTWRARKAPLPVPAAPPDPQTAPRGIHRRFTTQRAYARGMLAGRSGLSPVMVGRSAELRQLASLVDLVQRPAVALIAGEAGIGKTRMVQELLARAPKGTIILAGQADPETVGQPLQLVLDTLKGTPTLDEAGTPDGGDDLLAIAGDADRSTDERQSAAIELLRQITSGKPSLIVFEDLHWADAESLRVFEQLTEPTDQPLIAVGTFRPDGLSARHPASALLPRLRRRQFVTQIHLRRLSKADVGSFLGEVYGRAPHVRVVEALFNRTGGNPFFLEELIASAAGVAPEDLDSAPMPWTITELVQNQVADLSPEVRKVVKAASVLGRRFPFDVLAAVTETTEDELITLLREALESGVLVETEPDYFSFRHELAREAIDSGMLGRERRRLHETALETLRKAGSSDHAALAHHAQGARRLDDMIEHARLGAQEALLRGSSFQALQLAERGLDEADDDFVLLATATEAAWLSGLLDTARQLAERWLRLAREHDDVTQEAEALSRRIRVAFELADQDAMEALTDVLIGTVDRLPSATTRARAMAIVAQSYMLREQIDEASEWADKAHAVADSHDLPMVRAAAMVEKGSALLVAPQSRDEGRRLLEAAIDEAEKLGEHVLAGRALNNLAWHAPAWSSLAEIETMAERMRYHAKAGGWTGSFCGVQVEALVAGARGDLDQAITMLDEDRQADLSYGLISKQRMSSVSRAGFAIEAGDLDGAERFLELALAGATAAAITEVMGVEVNLAARRGDLERTREALGRLRDSAVRRDYLLPAVAHDVVAATLAVGIAVDELLPLVERVGYYVGHRLPGDDPHRQFIDAQLAEAGNDIEKAATLYAAAAEHLEGEQDIIAGHLGTAHVRAARCLISLGRLPEARQQAEKAGSWLSRWRGWRVAELEAVERRLGLGADTEAAGTLTRREREVAELLARGLSNSQVANELYISPRTAAVHVSNILSKLNMGSRTEVAAWVAAGGLSETVSS